MNDLPKEYQRIYKSMLKDYSDSRGLIRKLLSVFKKYFHWLVYKSYPNANSILEIGAGNLNHVRFEKKFISYDVIEPNEDRLNSAKNTLRKKISNSYKSIDQIKGENIYDKIISIAVLEHIKDLDGFLKKTANLLKPKGRFIVQIPAEGEFLYWLSWRLTTGIAFWLKYKLNYGVIIRYGHINKAKDIISLLNKNFQILKIYSFPFNLKSFRFYIQIEMEKLIK